MPPCRSDVCRHNGLGDSEELVIAFSSKRWAVPHEIPTSPGKGQATVEWRRFVPRKICEEIVEAVKESQETPTQSARHTRIYTVTLAIT